MAAADSSVKSVLQSEPPADDFYFGNPQNALHTSVSYAFMTSSMNSRASSSRGHASALFASQSSASASKNSSSHASSATAPAKSSGNAHGRPFRGERGGKRR